MNTIKAASLLSALSVSVVGGLMASAPVAHAALNDAVLRNDSNRPILVCKDARSATECLAGSPRKTLRPGQNTKTAFGWKDTDMFYIPAGCFSGGYNGPRWLKKGGSAGLTQSIYYDCR